MPSCRGLIPWTCNAVGVSSCRNVLCVFPVYGGVSRFSDWMQVNASALCSVCLWWGDGLAHVRWCIVLCSCAHAHVRWCIVLCCVVWCGVVLCCVVLFISCVYPLACVSAFLCLSVLACLFAGVSCLCRVCLCVGMIIFAAPSLAHHPPELLQTCLYYLSNLNWFVCMDGVAALGGRLTAKPPVKATIVRGLVEMLCAVRLVPLLCINTSTHRTDQTPFQRFQDVDISKQICTGYAPDACRLQNLGNVCRVGSCARTYMVDVCRVESV